MKYLLAFFILISSSAFAVDDGDFWLQREVKIGDGKNDYHKRVYGQYARTKFESSSNLTTGQKENVKALIERSVVVDKPTPTKVGGAMFKRLSAYAKAPGVQLLGVIAVTELLEAIGWVMEDGAYVKYVDKKNCNDPTSTATECNPSFLYSGSYNQTHARDKPSPESACSYLMTDTLAKETFTSSTPRLIMISEGFPLYECIMPIKTGGIYNVILTTKKNPDYIVQEPESQKVPLTPALLGAAMLGEGYNDPADSSVNDRVNTGDYTSVAETYNQDPSGVGNEVADAFDDKAKNAKPTPDNKPAPLGDPRYDDSGEIFEDDNSKDRKWEEDGDTATGETKPTTDPETGEQTGGQSISLQFPVFCTWAFKMCAWYDDWKKSDKVYKDHVTKTEEHQEKEKSFWEKVTDWFDWTKEEPDDKDQPDQEEPDTQGIFSKKFDAVFSLSKECPPDLKFNLETKYLTGTWDFSLNWLCIFFTFIAYPLQLLSHMIGLWVLYEACIRKEIKW